jgi:hypothetical protein
MRWESFLSWLRVQRLRKVETGGLSLTWVHGHGLLDNAKRNIEKVRRPGCIMFRLAVDGMTWSE